MHRKRLLLASTIAGLASAFVLCGVASAGTKSSTAAEPAGPQASTARGVVQITGYSDNDGARSTVILTGAIGDFGEAVRTGATGTNKQEYTQLDVVVTHGSFRLGIADIEHDLVSAFSHFPSNTNTCSGVVTAGGKAPIVPGSGTGAYKGIDGSFKMTVTIHEVDSWPKCIGLLSEAIVTTGSGNVSFG